MKKRILPVLLVIAALAVISYFTYDYIKDKTTKNPNTVEASGVIEVETITLSSPTGAKLIEAGYNEDDSIEAKKIAARMDDSLIEKQIEITGTSIETAITQIEAAKIQYNLAILRLKQAKENDITIEIAENNLEAARAQLELYKQQLSDFSIISPIEDIILNKFAEEGEYLLPGAPIYEIGDLYNMFCNIYIPEDEYGKIFLNQKAILTVDSYPDIEFTGFVSKISNEAEFTPKNIQTKEERTTTVYKITISIKNPDLKLKPDMPADVIINI